MKLVNAKYEKQFNFEQFLNYYFIIENQNEFLKIANEFYNEINDAQTSEFVLSENNTILDMNKCALLFYDFLSFQVNTKKIITEINNRILKTLQTGDYVESIFNLNKCFIDINEKVVDDFDFQIEYDAEFDYDKFVKFSNYKIAEDSTLLEKIIAFCKINSSLKKIKIAVFIGICNYLTNEEINNLAKQLNYFGIACVFLEGIDRNENCEFGKIIIDKDLCEL